MSYRRPSERHGYCAVQYSTSETFRRLARNEREPLLAACVAGQPWYDALDIYGDLVHIRCADVIEISDNSPAACAAYDAEQDEMKRHEVTEP